MFRFFEIKKRCYISALCFCLFVPGHQVHTYMDRVVFGKSYWKLHDLIDLPYFFYGRWHRKHFHDIGSVIIIARNAYPDDREACDAGYLHILLDDFCSNNPEWNKYLKKEAKQYYKRMRRSKKENKFKKKIRLSPKFEQLVFDFKKQIDAKKWWDRFFGLR